MDLRVFWYDFLFVSPFKIITFIFEDDDDVKEEKEEEKEQHIMITNRAHRFDDEMAYENAFIAIDAVRHFSKS